MRMCSFKMIVESANIIYVLTIQERNLQQSYKVPIVKSFYFSILTQFKNNNALKEHHELHIFENLVICG